MPKWKISFGLLLLLSFGALAVHGYHPYAEDAEIYLPGVEKALNPQLFPVHGEFFQTQGSLTLFPNLIAASVRWTHIPFNYALFLWQFACIFLLLLAAWQLSGLFFERQLARWGGVALLAALLTLPVAGTSLYILDQYLNPRNLAAFAGLFAVTKTLQGKLVRAALWAIFAVAIHPLMGWFSLSFCLLWLVLKWWERPWGGEGGLGFAAAILLLPNLLLPTTPEYHQAVLFHAVHYLRNWQWYEWLGIFAPVAIFWWIAGFARKRKRITLALVCRALIIYDVLYFAAGLIISLPRRFEALARIQPLRSLDLLYIFLILIGGGLIAEYLLKGYIWRWVVLFLPLCAGMFIAQRELFPASAHIEWPWAQPRNSWVQAFLWIRDNTPLNAVFAMDPLYLGIHGEDTQAFRPLAERSSVADAYKDSGTVSMFPPLAQLWWQEYQAERNWRTFGPADFARLYSLYGVNWVVLQSPGVPGLDCPYHNSMVLVCRVVPPER